MTAIHQVLKQEFSAIWKLSLLSFVIAALTGVLYRYGFFGPLPDGLHLSNIRHAHSHLMFFNWITPPILIWMAAAVLSPGNQRSARQFKICLYNMMGLGFLSWPYFLLYGYRPVAIGSASLPVAAILSGMVMLTWYWFGALYYGRRKKLRATFPLLLYDAALAALVVSSLGAWGVSVYQFSSIESPLISKALTSFFLGLFTEGWVVLGVLGIVWSAANSSESSLKINQNWFWMPLLFGSMLIFPFSLDQSILTPAMLYSAKVGLLLILLSLVLHLYRLLKSSLISSGVWLVVLMFLGLKVLFQAGAFLPTGIWPGEHGLRILYLHLVLLGFGSTGLIAAFYPTSERLTKWIYIIGAVAILITLGMFSGYWPKSLIPGNLIYLLAITAILPVIPIIWLLFKKA
ncbi:hypothetical protein [Rhodohalobacter sp. 8-1]|uniref:hypothetical protein n=1 Tax=Rhodohalobacter sp. 8-1 TaxID=3131972 RepID=UPI0030ECFD98